VSISSAGIAVPRRRQARVGLKFFSHRVRLS